MIKVGAEVHCLIAGSDGLGRKTIETISGRVVGETEDTYIVKSPRVKGVIHYMKNGEGKSIFALREQADWRREDILDAAAREEKDRIMQEDA